MICFYVLAMVKNPKLLYTVYNATVKPDRSLRIGYMEYSGEVYLRKDRCKNIGFIVDSLL